MIETDVCIIGAGPGGAATALRLSYLGIPCVLLDKAVLPRDKICGDALSGKVTTLLNRLDPQIMKRFHGKPIHVDVWGIRFFAPNGRPLDLPFQLNYTRKPDASPGYVSTRMDFDHFLIEEVKQRADIDLREGVDISRYERSERGWKISDAKGEVVIDTKLLIVANGAHSQFSRKTAGLEKEQAHHAAALRVYYRNVGGMSDDGFIELHFIKDITPGYFWIFPLPNGHANVGLGMRSDILQKKGLNLKKALQDIIENHPSISPRFGQAEQIDEVRGYGLPLGSKSRHISGDHFMLVGDAAYLIDPLSGEGIGNAFYSGFIAAEQAEQCLRADNFSEKYLLAYDVRVERVLGKEMKLSYQLQRMLAFPRLANLLAYIIGNNKKVIEVLTRMYNDFSLREQLVKPAFWVKMLFKR